MHEIQAGRVFSRVAGVAVGDHYNASISHNLQVGPLHVPLTSTRRHNFGTRDVQVNPLATRMVDSALNNVGTYGVRYDVDLNLSGQGAHQLVLSHPVVSGKKPFTAFRGSIQIQQGDRLEEIHVGLRSGESLALTDLRLQPGRSNPVRVSLVYPADATPGHLLSVVPVQQLAMLHQRQNLQREAQEKLALQSKAFRLEKRLHRRRPPQPRNHGAAGDRCSQRRSQWRNPFSAKRLHPTLPAIVPIPRPDPRFTDAIRSQQQWLLQLQGR